MENIRPVSDLRNHFAEISRQVHDGDEPVFLTKNGCGDMVMLSIETYRKLQYDAYIYLALREAEKEAALPQNWISDEDMRVHARRRLRKPGESDAL